MEETTSPAPNAFGEPWPDFNDGLTYTDVFKSASTTGCSLIDFYSSKYDNSAPQEGWLQRIRNGQVGYSIAFVIWLGLWFADLFITVNGQVVTDPGIPLRNGSTLLYSRLPWREPDAPHFLQILYEDDDMIAINKPSGLQVLPGGLFQQRTVLTQLQWLAEKRSSCALKPSGTTTARGSNPATVPVHRLGRGTSGVLLCAKTKIAKNHLAAYFADGTANIEDINVCYNKEICTARKISKIYRALASGVIDKDEVIVKQPIGMMRYCGVAKGLYVASSSGKPALSKVRVLERDVQQNCTLVQVEIQSGRPHQIRIHLSSMGHPLLGDPLYGAGGQPKCAESGSRDDGFAQDGGYHRPANAVPGDCGYYLHAHQLVLHHPTKSEVIKITAPLPRMLCGVTLNESCGNSDTTY